MKMEMKMEMKNKYLLITILISIAYVFPIVLSNVYYTDDMSRIVDGYGWHHDGRFISTYLARILSFNMHGITSLFPFSIFLSATIMVIAGFIIIHALDILTSSIRSYLPALFLLTSPFYLENLAYRFDSIYMSLSVFFSVLPFLFLGKNKFIVVSIFSLFLVFGLYQSSITLYIAIMLCIQVKNVANDKNIQWKLFLHSILAIVMSYILYKLALKGLSLEVGRSKLLPLNLDSLNVVENRIKNYRDVFYILFIKTKYIYAVFLIILLSMLGMVVSLYKKSFFKKITIYFICIIGIALSILLPNLILVTMWLTARTLIVFPVFLFFCAVFIDVFLKKYTSRNLEYIAYGMYVIFISYSFMLSSVFGTILKNNEEYQQYLANNITDRILNDYSSSPIGLAISGQAPIAPKSQFLYNNYPIMNMLAPNYISNSWYWGLKALSPFYNFSVIENQEELIKSRCGLKIISKNNTYSIFKSGNNYIIDFKNEC